MGPSERPVTAPPAASLTSDATTDRSSGFVKAISRLDATALVVGSMIGSGIFIVSADILRQVDSAGLLLTVWAVSGVVTLMGALSYGELAAMFPRAGGQYVYLREGISPLFGYLYGWTLSLAALALAMRFVPYSDDDGTLHAG